MRKLTLLSLLVLAATALAGYRNQFPPFGRAKKTRNLEWPGRYVCEQCSQSGKPCWSYELTILRPDQPYASEHRGHVLVHGPDGDLELKTRVVGDDGAVHFRYVEPADTSAPPPLSIPKGETLLTLEQRERTFSLSFNALVSKVADQTTVACRRN